MGDTHIITVSTDDKFYFPYLKESCSKYGNELVVLGYGEKWQGFNWRYAKTIEYLKTLDPEDIVCFVDGYDVICTRDLQDLKSEFLKIKEETGCKIIVGYDNINPLFNFFYWMYFGSCNGYFLNAGTYIGIVKDVLLTIQKIYNLNPNNNADDQVLLIKYCNLYPNDIFIDTKNKLFLVLPFPFTDLNKLITIEDNQVIYNNNKPFFIHAPGSGYLDNIIINLGYDYDYNDKIKDRLFKKVVYRVPYYLKEFLFDNIFIIVCILVIIIIYFKFKKLHWS